MTTTLLMELPKCSEHGIYMVLRPLACQTPEQKFCGAWYDCPACTQTVLFIGGYKNAPADAPAKEWGGIWAGPLPQPRDVNTPSNAGLGPLLDSEEDPARLWAEIHLLRAAVQGPDGYATWQDAATAERVRRVKAEKAHLANEAVPSVAADVWPNEQSR